jgi:hypothetical protein
LLHVYKLTPTDGGGIRGKSSLLILERIMEHIRDSEGLHEVPRPCDYFDVIGGTNTGGYGVLLLLTPNSLLTSPRIIAIMLGRLGMTVDECIRAYETVGRAAFTPKPQRLFRLSAKSVGAFSDIYLEAALKQIVRENCTDPACNSKRSSIETTGETCFHDELPFRDNKCTKTCVPCAPLCR